MAFEAHFAVTRMVSREGGVYGYAVDGSSGTDFMMELSALEG